MSTQHWVSASIFTFCMNKRDASDDEVKEHREDNGGIKDEPRHRMHKTPNQKAMITQKKPKLPILEAYQIT